MTTAPAPTPALDPVAETLATIDALLERSEALAAEVARLRQELDDVRHEQKLREAHFVLSGLPGKNEAERHAELSLRKHCDGDFRRMVAEERTLRQKLSEAESRLWSTRQRVHVCLALLRLAASAEAEASTDADEEDLS